MTFSESISTCFHKYVTFEGRASRSEYWWFFLFGLILGCIPAVNALAEVVLFLPGVAVCCRRLHDRGKTGWLQALPLGMILLGGFSAVVFGMSVFLGFTIVLAIFFSIWLLVECARE